MIHEGSVSLGRMRWPVAPLLLCSCGIGGVTQPDPESLTHCHRGDEYTWAEYEGGTCGSAAKVIARQQQGDCPSTPLSAACILPDVVAVDVVCPDGASWVVTTEQDGPGLRVDVTGPSDTAEFCRSSYKLTEKSAKSAR